MLQGTLTSSELLKCFRLFFNFVYTLVSVYSRFSSSTLAISLLFLAGNLDWIKADECHLTPVIHKLQYPGCQEKRIPSYACVGRCTSYVKVRFKLKEIVGNMHLFIIYRYLDPKFGRRKGHACAVKKAENA